MTSGGHPAERILASRFALVMPVLLAMLYPFLIASLGRSIERLHNAAGLPILLSWAVVVGLVLVYAVPAASFVIGHALGRLEQPTPRQLQARRYAHLAFTAPSLLIAMGNIAGIWHLRSVVISVWLALWIGIGALMLLLPAPRLTSVTRRPAFTPRLRALHGLSAVAILGVFLLPHLSNHLTGIWSGDTHIRVMTALRPVYRSTLVEPVLIALILFQMTSGVTMLLSRVRMRSASIFDTLQTMSGVYLAVFLVSHLTAAFSARWGHVDTNWHWLTNNGSSMLSGPSSAGLLPHYFLGPLLVAVHVGCGLRNVFLARTTSHKVADKLAGGIIAAGTVAAIAITAGLLGFHLSH